MLFLNPEGMVGPHDAIMAPCGVSGAALSDKITVISFIEDGVAQDRCEEVVSYPDPNVRNDAV